MSGGFSLDPRLAADTSEFAALALCDLRLMNDARFPWLVMVPRRPGKAEIIDLEPADRILLIEEIALVSGALRTVSGCRKLNVGALGNIVRQLHIHVVARDPGDAAWPGPVWGAGAALPYPPGEVESLAERLRAALSPDAAVA